jgi:hypothetical protein
MNEQHSSVPKKPKDERNRGHAGGGLQVFLFLKPLEIWSS